METPGRRIVVPTLQTPPPLPTQRCGGGERGGGEGRCVHKYLRSCWISPVHSRSTATVNKEFSSSIPFFFLYPLPTSPGHNMIPPPPISFPPPLPLFSQACRLYALPPAVLVAVEEEDEEELGAPPPPAAVLLLLLLLLLGPLPTSPPIPIEENMLWRRSEKWMTPSFPSFVASLAATRRRSAASSTD